MLNHEATENRNWYLVFSKPQKEAVAKENLDRQGYETYLPKIKRKKRIRGVQREVTESLFPRYLFIKLNMLNDDWGPIRSTLGVSHVVRFGHVPARIPDAFIDCLIKNENDSGFQPLEEIQLKIGDKVRLVDGAMEGYEGVFKAKSGKERVIVLLNIAGHCAEVDIPEQSVNLIST